MCFTSRVFFQKEDEAYSRLASGELNSYDFMSMVGEIEEHWDVEVDEREVVNVKTVKDAMEYIQSCSRLSEAGKRKEKEWKQIHYRRS